MLLERQIKEEKETGELLKMRALGNLEAIERVRQRAKLGTNFQKTKIALVFEGGGQKGAIGGGAAAGLEAAGVINYFDYLVGVSAGACAVAYTGAGQAELGKTLYYEDNIDGKFVDLKRLRKIMDTSVVERAMRYTKPVNVGVLKSAQPELIVGLFDAETGEEMYVNIKTLNDPIVATIASISVPILSGAKVSEVNGVPCLDGSLGDPIPVRFAIEELGATDVIVIKNGPFRKLTTRPWITRMFYLLARYHFSNNERVQEAITLYKKHYNGAIDFIQHVIINDPYCNIAVIAPENDGLSTFEMDREKLKKAALEAKSFTYELFK